MRLYPAFRFELGGYDFFVTKMNASEIAETVNFASDVFQGRTLSQAIQRNLQVSRSAKDIAFYWRENEARFFNSIVIAAWQGGATFQPIETLNSGVPFVDNLIANDGRMLNSFGILAFDGTEQYYALDGQHRVQAIKLMHQDPASHRPPDGFNHDEFTVILVPTRQRETEEEFRMRYRRMFSALNRYAKPTDSATNIIMDEDDIFAILTRRLISDHPFFRWGDNDWENERIKTDSGKNLSAEVSHFTQIEVLYAMNEMFLSSASRQNAELQDPKTFKQVRPADSVIDVWYAELATIWDGLIETIPALERPPTEMRVHNPDAENQDLADHLWFWPLGQQMIAKTVRMLIDKAIKGATPPSRAAITRALAPLGRIDWDLHAAPWRHLLLVRQDETSSWKMRSEQRSAALKAGEKLLLWFVGITDLDDRGVEALRDEWEFLLYWNEGDRDTSALWEQVEDAQVLAAGGHL